MKQFLGLLLITALVAPAMGADDPIFSGPQVGEKLAPLKVVGVFDAEEGKEFDWVKQAEGKPFLLVFVHQLTRPSIAVTRLLSEYAGIRRDDGMRSAVVFLGDDITATTERLKRARHALPQKSPVGISVDGAEGPGSYGLNRNMTLTIIVAKENKVTANFPLVQPSVQADVPKVLDKIVALIGGKAMTVAELGDRRYIGTENAKMMRRTAAANNNKKEAVPQDPNLRGYLAPIINKSASVEDVDKAVEKLEAYLAKHPVSRGQVGDIARRIINSGKLENYGTKRAQEHLKRWAKEFKSESGKNAREGVRRKNLERPEAKKKPESKD